MKPKTILLIILLFLSPAALGNNAGDDTDALLIAATYIGDGNGTIYCGYGTNPLDAVYTFKNGRIYKGDGRFTLSLDALYTIRDGRISRATTPGPTMPHTPSKASGYTGATPRSPRGSTYCLR